MKNIDILSMIISILLVIPYICTIGMFTMCVELPIGKKYIIEDGQYERYKNGI